MTKLIESGRIMGTGRTYQARMLFHAVVEAAGIVA
jgi:hypothetical protein